MKRKYVLTTNTKKVNGITLYQIKAIEAFSDVKKNELGGFVQDYDNLENDLLKGYSWLYDTSIAMENSRVEDNARVHHSTISGNAKVSGYAIVVNATLKDKVIVDKYAQISNVIVSDKVKITDYTKIRHGLSPFNRMNLKGSISFRKSIDISINSDTYADSITIRGNKTSYSSNNRYVIRPEKGETIHIKSKDDIEKFLENNLSHYKDPDPKFELTADTIDYEGETLYRIRALEDFADVRKGDLGGYVASANNIPNVAPHTAWVYDDSILAGTSMIIGSGKVMESSILKGDASITEGAIVTHHSVIKDKSVIIGSVYIHNKSVIRDAARIESYGRDRRLIIKDGAEVGGRSQFKGTPLVKGNAKIRGFAGIFKNAKIDGKGIIEGHTIITDNARIESFTMINSHDFSPPKTFAYRIEGFTDIHDNAKIQGAVNIAGSPMICGNVLMHAYNDININANILLAGDIAIPSSANIKEPLDVIQIPLLSPTDFQFRRDGITTITITKNSEGNIIYSDSPRRAPNYSRPIKDLYQALETDLWTTDMSSIIRDMLDKAIEVLTNN
ncbi:hypothetical protein [Mogibacterium diversum]|uniref:hypothetical protein n=1 Tax=Mogibacterium diversum TaxID=114527 RepID=UPI0028D09BCC|nr:hypothetical protein [Mogibacterium diversum]